jgi:hypothetical protein
MREQARIYWSAKLLTGPPHTAVWDLLGYISEYTSSGDRLSRTASIQFSCAKDDPGLAAMARAFGCLEPIALAFLDGAIELGYGLAGNFWLTDISVAYRLDSQAEVDLSLKGHSYVASIKNRMTPSKPHRPRRPRPGRALPRPH